LANPTIGAHSLLWFTTRSIIAHRGKTLTDHCLFCAELFYIRRLRRSSQIIIVSRHFEPWWGLLEVFKYKLLLQPTSRCHGSYFLKPNLRVSVSSAD